MKGLSGDGGRIRGGIEKQGRKDGTVDIFFDIVSWLGGALTFLSEIFVGMFSFLLNTN